MRKRIKKPAVKPEKRREWLKRSEEDGESPPQIARADGFDVRTVRKQIETARQERETREARSSVLRHALEQHYADLVALAQKVERALITPTSIPLAERGDRMWTALREHLPRSPMWKSLDRWEHLHTEIWRLEKEAERRLQSQVEASRSFRFRHGDEPGLHLDGLSRAVVQRLTSIAEAPDQSLPLHSFTSEPTPDGQIRIVYGSFLSATVPPDKEDETKEFIAALISGVSQWPECENMRRVMSELARITSAISEELATIILRRVVTGRCKYCPI